MKKNKINKTQWLAANAAMLKRKITGKNAWGDAQQFGTHKLTPIRTRLQGKDATDGKE